MKRVAIHASYKKLVTIDESKFRTNEDLSETYAEDTLKFLPLEEQTFENGDLKFILYECEYSSRKKYDSAYYNGSPIPYVDVVYKFNAYVDEELKQIFFNTNTDIGIGYIKVLNRFLKDDNFNINKVDFDYIRINAREVKASWFQNDGGMVTSQALIGNSIENSSEFLILKEKSTISSLTIIYYMKEYNMVLPIVISKKGSIYIQSNIPDKFHPIEIIYTLFRSLIK